MRGMYLGSLIVAGALGVGCGSITSATASLSITSPTNNSTVNVGTNNEIAVNFNTNYTLRAPGQCDSIQNCGHVWILVDSSTCNQKGQDYNTLAVSSPAEVNLGLCPTVAGTHTITAELLNDLNDPVNDALGNPATSSVTITAMTQ